MTYDPAENARKSYDVAIDAMREKLASFRCERIHDATLYLGDCREILCLLPKNVACIDVVISDPPYGVNLGSDPSHVIGSTPYASFEDSEENVRLSVVPIIEALLFEEYRMVITPGTRCAWKYPPPDEIGSIYFPAGAGFSRWGFTCSQPILFYGKDPYMPRNKKPNSVQCTENSEKNGHPCPKPIKLMEWVVERASISGETILDPFMGSGTTGVACAKLGRRFIGIELEPRYFDIACKRIDDAYRQPRLFKDEPPKPKQETLI